MMLCAITLALLRMMNVVRMARLSLDAPTMPKRSTRTMQMRRTVKREKSRVAERRSKQYRMSDKRRDILDESKIFETMMNMCRYGVCIYARGSKHITTLQLTIIIQLYKNNIPS